MRIDLILNSYDWAAGGTPQTSGFASKTVSLEQGDLLTFQGTKDYNIADIRLQPIISYSQGSFGYVQIYIARFKAWVVQKSGTYTLPAGPGYSCLLGWRPEYTAKYIPLSVIFYNDVPAGQVRTFDVPDGIVLIIPGNTTWAAELSWNPVVSGNITLLVNRREHDTFNLAGVSQSGTASITAALLQKWDALILPIRVNPEGRIYPSFVMV